MNIPIMTTDFPTLDTQQMIEVDRAMIEDYGIELIQMMENAGRNLAHLARERFMEGFPRGWTVTVLAGSGGNGGGALVCARHLHNYGAYVNVYITKEDAQFAPVPAHQLAILRRMGVPIFLATEAELPITTNLIIDGIIGYSLRGAPRGVAVDLINWANNYSAPTLSLDTPSGLDTTSGMIHVPTMQATATMTLALPKAGLLFPEAAIWVGELYLANISVPPELYTSPAINVNVGPIFSTSDIIRIR